MHRSFTKMMGAFAALTAATGLAACGGNVSDTQPTLPPANLDSGMPIVIVPPPPPVIDGGLRPPTDGALRFDAPIPPARDGSVPDGQVTTTDGGDFDSGPPVTSEGGADVTSGFDAPTDTASPPFDSELPDGGWRVADHYPMPQVESFGGSTLSAPVFTAITFPGYDLTSEAQNFVATVGATSYWAAATQEYGVGPGTNATPIELTEAAPSTIDDSGVQTWLAGKLDGTNPAFGTPTANSVYVIYYPSGTSVTLDGLQSCVGGGFGGYHNSTTITSGPFANQQVSYAVVPECAFDGTTAQQLTESGSHELIEASTDPLPQTNDAAFVQVDQNDIIWELVLGGGEVADMCAQNQNADFTPDGYPYLVQRSWSNEAASEGHDPCQPSLPGTVFFNAIATMTNTNAPISDQGQNFTTAGVTIPLNQSKTVDVTLYSDGPGDDWTVQADDLSDVLGGGPYLNFSWDKTTGNNGTVLHLTITPVAGGQFGGEPFAIFSTKDGSNFNASFGYVAQ